MDQNRRVEQRLKTLEYELKILKNEIQKTLLDIQEQILTHYYPTLYPSDQTEATPDGGAPSQQQGIAPGPAPAPAPPAAGTAVAIENRPPVTQVSLDQIRQMQGQAAARPEAGTASQPAQGAGQANVIALSEWVSNCAGKIGGERTRKLVQASAQKGLFTDEIRDLLMRLVSVGNGGDPEGVAINEILNAVLKLNELLGRVATVEEALTLIEDANLG